MEYQEFFELTEQLVEQLMPRIPERYANGFKGILAGGEPGIAVEDLVYTVVDDQIPVSAEEFANLRALAAEHWESTKLMAKLEQVEPT